MEANNVNQPLERVITLIGSPAELAEKCSLKSTMAISQWRRRGVPVERVLMLCELVEYKVTPHQLSPDHYPHPDDGLPEAMRGAA